MILLIVHYSFISLLVDVLLKLYCFRPMSGRQDNSRLCPKLHAVDLRSRSLLNREPGAAARCLVGHDFDHCRTQQVLAHLVALLEHRADGAGLALFSSTLHDRILDVGVELLAKLYEASKMPPELRKAHQANDRAVMKAYGYAPSMTEPEIVADLMKRYQELTAKEK